MIGGRYMKNSFDIDFNYVLSNTELNGDTRKNQARRVFERFFLYYNDKSSIENASVDQLFKNVVSSDKSRKPSKDSFETSIKTLSIIYNYFENGWLSGTMSSELSSVTYEDYLYWFIKRNYYKDLDSLLDFGTSAISNLTSHITVVPNIDIARFSFIDSLIILVWYGYQYPGILDLKLSTVKAVPKKYFDILRQNASAQIYFDLNLMRVCKSRSGNYVIPAYSRSQNNYKLFQAFNSIGKDYGVSLFPSSISANRMFVDIYKDTHKNGNTETEIDCIVRYKKTDRKNKNVYQTKLQYQIWKDIFYPNT